MNVTKIKLKKDVKVQYAIDKIELLLDESLLIVKKIQHFINYLDSSDNTGKINKPDYMVTLYDEEVDVFLKDMKSWEEDIINTIKECFYNHEILYQSIHGYLSFRLSSEKYTHKPYGYNYTSNCLYEFQCKKGEKGLLVLEGEDNVNHYHNYSVDGYMIFNSKDYLNTIGNQIEAIKNISKQLEGMKVREFRVYSEGDKKKKYYLAWNNISKQINRATYLLIYELENNGYEIDVDNYSRGDKLFQDRDNSIKNLVNKFNIKRSLANKILYTKMESGYKEVGLNKDIAITEFFT